MAALARGVILREDRDTLIVQAAPEDVARFALGRPVAVTQAPERRAGGPELLGETLYTAGGVPVCVVMGLSVDVDRIETTRFGDSFSSYAAGRRNVRIDVAAHPGLLGSL